MKIIDLGGPIKTNMWSYGSPFPTIKIEQIAYLNREGYQAHRLNLHTLAGTYVETADHLFAKREKIAEVPFERLIVRAWIAQLQEKGPLEPITPDELVNSLDQVDIQPGDAILIATGWDRMWHESLFIRECPYFLPETMDWIIKQNVGLLGVDIPSIEDPRSNSFEMNQLARFYSKDRLLLAPLVNLRKAGKGPYTLIVLPLNIPDVCASPCRPVLVDNFTI